MLKKIFYIILSYTFKINNIFADLNSNTIKNWLNSWQNNLIIEDVEYSEVDTIWTLLNYIQNSITELVVIIAIWVFLYIWINLVIARWNPEEFKKHITHFVYAAVWFFIIAAAWIMVKLVLSLNIN